MGRFSVRSQRRFVVANRIVNLRFEISDFVFPIRAINFQFFIKPLEPSICNLKSLAPLLILSNAAFDPD